MYTCTANSQHNFEFGLGMPIEENEEMSFGSFYADLQYRFTTYKAPVELLGLAGLRYINVIGDGGVTGTYLPLGGGVKLNPLDFLSLGAHAGYGISLEQNFDGGFFYRPFVGILFTSFLNVIVSYEGIADIETLENVYFGVLLEF